MAGAARRRQWRIALLALAGLAAALAAAGWYGLSMMREPGTQATAPAAVSTVPSPLPARRPVAGADPVQRLPAADERSGNLQAAFAALWQSKRPTDKARAVSLWNGCVPVFLGAGTQAASLQRAIAGLPSDSRYDLQRSAYADLFGRCKQFFGDTNAELSVRTGQLRQARLNGEAVTSARLATDAAARGDAASARTLAAGALATGDPYEMFELAGMPSKLLPSDATPPQLAKAKLQDLALPLAACELGMDCQMNSLLAVRLCAFEALCNGTVGERLRAKYAPDIDPAQVAPEVARLVAINRGADNTEHGSAQRASALYFAP